MSEDDSKALTPTTSSDLAESEKGSASRVSELAASTAQAELVKRAPPSGVRPGMAAAVLISKVTLPLPPPEFLRQYEDLVPGFAARAATDWETERNHRRAMESQKQAAAISARDHDLRTERLRVHFGFAVAFAGLAVTVLLACLGHVVAAPILGTASLATMVGSFLRRRATRREGEE